MTYQPVVIGPGLAGWRFLQATLPRQQAAFNQSGDVQRPLDYFREKIGSIDTAADLVGDRRLLDVALTAFGLGGDIDNRYFIQKVLEDGTLKTDALAMKLSDERYRDFSAAFGFGDFSVPRTRLSDFGDSIAARYEAQAFEEAVGQTREDMRLALNLQRQLPEITKGTEAIDTLWYKIMGTPPVRTVFETALGLPQGFGQLEIDQQLEVFKTRAEARFGTADPRELAADGMMEKVTDTYLLQSQVKELAQSQLSSAALAIMQSAADFQRSLSPAYGRAAF